MRPGSVLVDLAAERGGNVEGAVPGKIVETKNGVKIVGLLNWPSRLASDASAMFAKNLKNFKHSGISQCVGLNTLQVQKFGNTLIIRS